MLESALYPSVKRFLQSRGYDVKGEIGGCDVMGVAGGEVVVCELKLSLSFEVVLQAVERMACADAVWIAVRATRRGRDRDPRARRLCRLLGLGLLAVRPTTQAAEVLAEPEPYQPRPNRRKRARLVAEHRARRGDPSPGGTSRLPIVTAYRQDALACAALLRDGPATTRTLAAASPRATSIVYRNVYGWFERRARGVYALTPTGAAALGAVTPAAPSL